MKLTIRKTGVFSIILACSIIGVQGTAQDNVIAFPGAEGAGMFTTGGRGCPVYEVTSLDDNEKNKAMIPGTFRDAVSGSDRTIVFRVSGILHLKYALKITGSNLTIAGQTAPGDGFCIADHVTWLEGSNIIMRYLHFRAGSANIKDEPDALTGIVKDSHHIILDHISASWSTDECLSVYRTNGLTVQWCIVAESLTMSGHAKGRHGYGGIWGGANATFHHNLLATHTSRLPRVDVGGNKISSRIDIRNNVIYNWEFNSTYGGDTASTNIINNYYKPGPGTKENVRRRMLDPTFKKSEWYLKGNIMDGSPDITADNSKGIMPEDPTDFVILDSPIILPGTINTTDAKTAYEQVLLKSGSTYPKRDSVDARILNDVRTGKGRFVNLEREVGGYPEYATTPAPADSDHDGMPDAWETAHKLNPKDAKDGEIIGKDGYSNLEKYLNSLVDMNFIPANPVVQITSPAYNSFHTAGSDVTVYATAISVSKKKISKVEFYRDNEKFGESFTVPYLAVMKDVPDGSYFITARAFDANGLSTSSSVIPIFVNRPKKTGDWKSVDVGRTGLPGTAFLDDKGIFTIKGAGSIAIKRDISKKSKDPILDTFQYVYQILVGDGELSAQIDDIAKVNNQAFVGLMIRQDLRFDSPLACVVASYVKSDKKKTPYSARFGSRSKKGETIVSGEMYEEFKVPGWLKIVRKGQDIASFVSLDGKEWEELDKKTVAMSGPVYIGFIVDAARNDNKLENYNSGKFSNISLKKAGK
jgi:hypothetical protein